MGKCCNLIFIDFVDQFVQLDKYINDESLIISILSCLEINRYSGSLYFSSDSNILEKIIINIIFII